MPSWNAWSAHAKDIVMTAAADWIAGERLIQEGERTLLLRLLRKRFGNAVDAAVEQRHHGVLRAGRELE
jgi:hypothetical protein